MNDEPKPSAAAPLRPTFVWAWRSGPQDAEAGTVEARLAQLVACGWEAVLLESQPPGNDRARLVRLTAMEKSLRVIEAPAARAVRLESLPTDRQIEDLAHAWVEQADLEAIVCSGPEQDCAALLAAARQLRRRLDRLSWERYQ